MSARKRLTVAAGLILAVLTCSLEAAAAATFVIDNIDAPGVGFNDPTPARPVGGNSGTTVGEQRLIALQYAAELWGAVLDSPIPIVVAASFESLECSDAGAILAQAGTTGLHWDVPGQPSDVLFSEALANHLAGEDLMPEQPEIEAIFNGGLEDCMGADWYLGLDANPEHDHPDFVETALHELAHGLGFSSYVDLETGAAREGMLDTYSLHLMDNALGLRWDEMTDAERAVSIRNPRHLVWTGGAVTEEATRVLALGSPVLATDPALTGFGGLVSEANFGPPVLEQPATGLVAIGEPWDGCEPMADLSGNVALVGGGVCSNLLKAQHAEEAGAVALLIAALTDQVPPPSVQAYWDEVEAHPIDIPVLGVSLSDADLLRRAPAGSVSVSLSADADRLVGADAQGRVYLNATDPAQPGASVSHWDALARPDLLLEASSAVSVGHHLEMERALLEDIGWGQFCGNGQVDPGEECDDGAANSDTEPDACRSDCTAARCGDGVIDSNELCDDGVTGGDSCTQCGGSGGSAGADSPGGTGGGDSAGGTAAGGSAIGGAPLAGRGASNANDSGVTNLAGQPPAGTAAAQEDDAGGCGCRAVGNAGRSHAWAVAVGLLAWLGRRSRRRRR